MASPITLRCLRTDEEYEQCLELQRRTWGSSFRELVPPTLLKISQKVGGVVAGAFGEDKRLLGFVYGMTGVGDDGRLVHWSHMLAVVDDARGLGLGKRLKAFQRKLLLERGVELMHWTYDPLIARNANLNLNRLGARAREYVRDMYGGSTGSEAHGLGTDRFIVEWELRSPQVERMLATVNEEEASGEHRRPLAEVADAEVVNSALIGEQPQPRVTELPDAPRLWVEIPADVDALKASAPAVAREWRRVTRQAFEHYLERDYTVTGFAFLVPTAPSPARCFYRLERAASP